VGKPEDVTSKDEHGTINNIADFEIELTRDKRQYNGTVNTNQDHKLFKSYIVDQSANSTETEMSSLLNMAEEAEYKIVCPMFTGLYMFRVVEGKVQSSQNNHHASAKAAYEQLSYACRHGKVRGH